MSDETELDRFAKWQTKVDHAAPSAATDEDDCDPSIYEATARLFNAAVQSDLSPTCNTRDVNGED
jgi:hypothetical protein